VLGGVKKKKSQNHKENRQKRRNVYNRGGVNIVKNGMTEACTGGAQGRGAATPKNTWIWGKKRVRRTHAAGSSWMERSYDRVGVPAQGTGEGKQSREKPRTGTCLKWSKGVVN